MNAWLIAAGILLLGLIPCGVVIVRCSTADGMVALELAGTVTVLVLMMLARGYGRSSFLDVALTFAILGFPAGLVFVHFLERWL